MTDSDYEESIAASILLAFVIAYFRGCGSHSLCRFDGEELRFPLRRREDKIRRYFQVHFLATAVARSARLLVLSSMRCECILIGSCCRVDNVPFTVCSGGTSPCCDAATARFGYFDHITILRSRSRSSTRLRIDGL